LAGFDAFPLATGAFLAGVPTGFAPVLAGAGRALALATGGGAGLAGAFAWVAFPAGALGLATGAGVTTGVGVAAGTGLTAGAGLTAGTGFA
jgi:hypothetical protein